MRTLRRFALFLALSAATVWLNAQTLEKTLETLPQDQKSGVWGAVDNVMDRTQNLLNGINGMLGGVNNILGGKGEGFDQIADGIIGVAESVSRNIARQRRELETQIKALEKKVHAPGIAPTESAADRMALARCYTKMGQYDSAARVLREYHDAAYAAGLDKSKPAEVAAVLSQLAEIYSLAGKDAELRKISRRFEALDAPEAPVMAALTEARRCLNIMDLPSAEASLHRAIEAIKMNKLASSSDAFGQAYYLVAVFSSAKYRLSNSVEDFQVFIKDYAAYAGWIGANCQDVPHEYLDLCWEVVRSCCDKGIIDSALELAQSVGQFIQKIYPNGSVEELSYLLALGDLAYANSLYGNKVSSAKLNRGHFYYYRGTKLLAELIWRKKEERTSNPVMHKINRSYALAMTNAYPADKKKARDARPTGLFIDVNTPEYKTYAKLDSTAESRLRISRKIYESELADYRAEIHDRFLQLTERERTTYKQNLSALISDIYNFAELDDTKATRNMVYDATLLNKAVLLGLSRNLQSLVMKSGDENLKRLYGDLAGARNELLTEENAPKPDASRIAALNDRIQSAELRLLQQLSNVAGLDAGAFINTTSKDIRDMLDKKAKDVAIEFYDFDNRFTGGHSLRMVAVRNDKSPQIFRLEPNQAQFAKAIPDENAMRHYSNVVWKPLLDKKWLKPGASIYFSTSGRLNLLPIEFVPSPDGSGNMNDTYRIYRVSSTRNIKEVATRLPLAGRRAVLFGDLAYSYTGGGDAVGQEQAETASALRGGSTDFFNPLSFTRDEMEDIADVLSDAGSDVISVEGSDGVENRVKELSGTDVSVLHLATHGAFKGEPAVKSGTAEDLERSMNLSFLAMSGINNPTRLRRTYSDSDGRLTAREISNLDLSHVDLVVMSACESGLGQINADGVFGLQRGFKLAGAKTLVMSLWKVNDKATRVMMTEFYKALAAGDSKTTAFSKAQKVVRSGNYPNYDADGNPLPDRPGTDPAIWSAFVMMD